MRDEMFETAVFRTSHAVRSAFLAIAIRFLFYLANLFRCTLDH